MARSGCTPRRQALFLSILGLALMVIAIVIPPLLTIRAEREICNEFCVPLHDAPEWQRQNWLSNRNASAHAAEYIEFFLYNVTNVAELTRGMPAQWDEVGPYVFRVWRDKFNIQYRKDNKVSFEERVQYEFNSQRTAAGLSVTDSVIVVQLPVLASMQLLYHARGSTYDSADPFSTRLGLIGNCNYPTSDGPVTTDPASSACLFAQMDVASALFGYRSNSLDLLNQYAFSPNLDGSGWVDPIFALFESCNRTSQCHQQSTMQHNFGLGGACRASSFKPSFSSIQQCSAPGAFANVSWIKHTGHGDIESIGGVVAYASNSSISLDSVPRPVAGSDQRNVRPWLVKSAAIPVWEMLPLAMQATNVTFAAESETAGVSTFQFAATSIFVENITDATNIRFGVPMPLLVRPSGSGDQPTSTMLDVEPLTGFVLRRETTQQLSVRLGGDPFGAIGCAAFDKVAHPYACIQPTTVPVVRFNLVSAFDSTHTSATGFFRRVLAAVVTANRLYHAALLGGSISGAVLVIAALYIVINDTCCREHLRRIDKGAAYFDYPETRTLNADPISYGSIDARPQ